MAALIFSILKNPWIEKKEHGYEGPSPDPHS
jgi:hypothetical protein